MIPYEMIHVRRDRPVAPNGWPLDRWTAFLEGVSRGGFRIVSRETSEWGDIVVVEKHMGDHWRTVWYGPDRKRALTFNLLSQPHERTRIALHDARTQYAAHREALILAG